MVEVPGDIKTGKVLLIDDAPCQVNSFTSKKIGKGIAKTTMQIKNLVTGSTTEKAFNSGTKLQECDIEVKEATYSYKDDIEDKYFFMDSETFEEIEMNGKTLVELGLWLSDGQELAVQWYEGTPLNIRFTNEIIMEVESVFVSAGRESNDAQITLTNGLIQK